MNTTMKLVLNTGVEYDVMSVAEDYNSGARYKRSLSIIMNNDTSIETIIDDFSAPTALDNVKLVAEDGIEYRTFSMYKTVDSVRKVYDTEVTHNTHVVLSPST